MSEDKELGMDELGTMAGNYATRSSASLDLLQPWKIISQNNVYIIYLSVLLFALYAFTRHGFNWIALSTSHVGTSRESIVYKSSGM